MLFFEAIFLGAVQGLAEFLPISSSGHLVLIPWFFGFKDLGLAFDASLHFGTAIAVLGFFWRDFDRLLRAFVRSIATRAVDSQEARLSWYLVIASIPGGIAGILLEKKAESLFRSPLLVAASLAIMGIALLAADKLSARAKDISHLGLKDALLVGCMQALAIIPGISRSGITMTAALTRNYDRRDAARFSFLLSAPITLGAALFEFRKLEAMTPDAAFFAGVLTSAIVGYLSIKYLLKFLETRSFAVFAIYRVALALVVAAIYVSR